MPALGQKPTFGGLAEDVRFTPESGPPEPLPEMSCVDGSCPGLLDQAL